MYALTSEQGMRFREAVGGASARADVHLAIDVIYEALQDAIDLRRPSCRASGRCCRFEEFGHRLFVTTMEVARFVSQLADLGPEGSAWRSGAPDANASHVSPLDSNTSESNAWDSNTWNAIAWDGSGCQFQVGGLCGVHAIRPFGCRVYFCDPTADEWQRQQYERFHSILKRRHEELNVPYFYVEWREALSALRGQGRRA